jgi:hypothetical protein
MPAEPTANRKKAPATFWATKQGALMPFLFAQVPSYFLADKRLADFKPVTQLHLFKLFTYLCGCLVPGKNYTSPENGPTQSVLSRVLGLSQSAEGRTVRKLISILNELGYLTIKHQFSNRNVYELHLPDVVQDEPPFDLTVQQRARAKRAQRAPHQAEKIIATLDDDLEQLALAEAMQNEDCPEASSFALHEQSRRAQVLESVSKLDAELAQAFDFEDPLPLERKNFIKMWSPVSKDRFSTLYEGNNHHGEACTFQVPESFVFNALSVIESFRSWADQRFEARRNAASSLWGELISGYGSWSFDQYADFYSRFQELDLWYRKP